RRPAGAEPWAGRGSCGDRVRGEGEGPGTGGGVLRWKRLGAGSGGALGYAGPPRPVGATLQAFGVSSDPSKINNHQSEIKSGGDRFQNVVFRVFPSLQSRNCQYSTSIDGLTKPMFRTCWFTEKLSLS